LKNSHSFHDADSTPSTPVTYAASDVGSGEGREGWSRCRVGEAPVDSLVAPRGAFGGQEREQGRVERESERARERTTSRERQVEAKGQGGGEGQRENASKRAKEKEKERAKEREREKEREIERERERDRASEKEREALCRTCGCRSGGGSGCVRDGTVSRSPA